MHHSMDMRRLAGRGRRAFTFIEILIVVAIIAMLAAVGIIQLLRARIATNEQLAITSLRLLSKSCGFFYLARQAYPAALTDLGPPASIPPYIDDAGLLAGTKQGYQFIYTPGPTTFTLRGNPVTHGTTGVRHFFLDQNTIIHATEQNQDATAADPVIPTT